MAMSRTVLMPVRALIALRRNTLEINKDIWSNWTFVSSYRTKTGVIHKHRHSPPETFHKGKMYENIMQKILNTSFFISDSVANLCTGRPDLLREFPQPKNLLYATLSKSLGLSDLSQYIQYSCTDGEVKVRRSFRTLGQQGLVA